jgi:D-alanyl-D-alanine dipeptidase
LLRLVECGRQLDVENIPLAVGLGQALLGCEGIFPEAIASRLQGVIPKLSAESFSELCSLLDDISENSKASVLPADKFPGKQKTTSLRVQPAQRNEFREAKQQRTVPKARAHLKPSQLPASALRDLEEAMDRSIMPSQREAHSGDTHGVGATTHKRGEQADFQAIAQRLMHLAPPIVDSLRRLEGLGPVEIRETEPLVDLSEGSKLLIHPYYHDAGLPNAEKAIHVRTTVAERLRFAASQLPDEFCLIILDGWRSGALQRDVFIHVSQQAKGTPNLGKYVIDPDNPAAGVSYPTGAPPHRTGGAVDVTLGYVPSIWWPMGVGFDEMCPRAKTDVFEGADHDLEQRAAVVARFGRRLLVHVMASAGFSNYPEEIWHFDYGNSFWRHFGRIPGKGVYGCTGQ